MSLSLIKKYLKDELITFFDVGAKDGVTDLKKLASLTKVYAFEANPEEYTKLLHQKHDYALCNFYNEALNDTPGFVEYRIANKASYSSMLEFDKQKFQNHLGLMPFYDQWTQDFSTDKTICIKANTTDEFCRANNISYIDFLKLDTQGSELQILNGSDVLLKQILVIKCEITFIPVYKTQALFSSIDLFLREREFEFVDCIFYPDSVMKNKIFQPKNKIYDTPRFATGGDAIYMKNGALPDKLSQLKMGLILASMGYLSEAYFLLDKQSIPQSDIKSILHYLGSKSSVEKLKHIAKSWMPPEIFRFLKSLF